MGNEVRNYGCYTNLTVNLAATLKILDGFYYL